MHGMRTLTCLPSTATLGTRESSTRSAPRAKEYCTRDTYIHTYIHTYIQRERESTSVVFSHLCTHTYRDTFFHEFQSLLSTHTYTHIHTVLLSFFSPRPARVVILPLPISRQHVLKLVNFLCELHSNTHIRLTLELYILKQSLPSYNEVSVSLWRSSSLRLSVMKRIFFHPN